MSLSLGVKTKGGPELALSADPQLFEVDRLVVTIGMDLGGLVQTDPCRTCTRRRRVL